MSFYAKKSWNRGTLKLFLPQNSNELQKSSQAFNVFLMIFEVNI